MELISQFVDIFLHLDTHLDKAILDYGAWIYLILFAIIFCETGLVITPILPGDSLLFAAGAFAARGSLDVWKLLLLLSIAAIAGDALNYAIGAYIGPKAMQRDGRFLKREYLERTRRFFEKYGPKTIVLARFVPIVRTFAPFMAGIGTMSYWRFASYNVIGGIAWVSICVLAGYMFGGFEFVQKNFEFLVIAIVLLSVLPMAWEWWAARREKKAAALADADVPRPAE